MISLCLSLVLQGRVLLAQFGHWAQPRCLLLELGLEQLPCPLEKLGLRQWLQQQQRWCQLEGCDCLLGWRCCRAGWGVSVSRSACRFVSLPFPLRALNSVEQGT